MPFWHYRISKYSSGKLTNLAPSNWKNGPTLPLWLWWPNSVSSIELVQKTGGDRLKTLMDGLTETTASRRVVNFLFLSLWQSELGNIPTIQISTNFFPANRHKSEEKFKSRHNRTIDWVKFFSKKRESSEELQQFSSRIGKKMYFWCRDWKPGVEHFNPRYERNGSPGAFVHRAQRFLEGGVEICCSVSIESQEASFIRSAKQRMQFQLEVKNEPLSERAISNTGMSAFTAGRPVSRLTLFPRENGAKLLCNYCGIMWHFVMCWPKRCNNPKNSLTAFRRVNCHEEEDNSTESKSDDDTDKMVLMVGSCVTLPSQGKSKSTRKKLHNY